MGKGKGKAAAAPTVVAQDPAARRPNTSSFCVWLWTDSGVCKKSTLKWVAAVAVSINLLIFALLTLDPFHRQQAAVRQPSPPVPPPQVLATFVLQLRADRLNDSIARLQADLEAEVSGLDPSLRVRIVSVEETGDGGDAVVAFAVVVPDGPPAQAQQRPGAIDRLRAALVTVFLNQNNNINLDDDGPFKGSSASQFQILRFPGGLTMQPDASDDQHLLSTSLLLFNFTLPKNLVTIIHSYDRLKTQIAVFTGVRTGEKLDVKLTNVAGSTVYIPVVVQVSIASAVPGKTVPPLRLEQLAQVLTDDAAASHNLGLDMSTFGDVQALNLSYTLVQHLRPAPAPAPAPAPSPRRSASPHPPHTPSLPRKPPSTPPPPPARGTTPSPSADSPRPLTRPSPTNSSSPPHPSASPAPRPSPPAQPQPPPAAPHHSSSSRPRAHHVFMLCFILPAIVLA